MHSVFKYMIGIIINFCYLSARHGDMTKNKKTRVQFQYGRGVPQWRWWLTGIYKKKCGIFCLLLRPADLTGIRIIGFLASSQQTITINLSCVRVVFLC